MRKKNSIINMIVGLVGQLLNMLLSFGGRMVFVHYLSQEYLGVNGLFGDVLGMLNLAELGIGSAMIFSMYRPAAQNDEQQLARLMNLCTASLRWRCWASGWRSCRSCRG